MQKTSLCYQLILNIHRIWFHTKRVLEGKRSKKIAAILSNMRPGEIYYLMTSDDFYISRWEGKYLDEYPWRTSGLNEIMAHLDADLFEIEGVHEDYIGFISAKITRIN